MLHMMHVYPLNVVAKWRPQGLDVCGCVGCEEPEKEKKRKPAKPSQANITPDKKNIEPLCLSLQVGRDEDEYEVVYGWMDGWMDDVLDPRTRTLIGGGGGGG